MSEIVQEFLKRFSIFAIVLGGFLLIIGVAGKIEVGNVVLQPSGSTAQWIVLVIGGVLVLSGLFWEWRDTIPRSNAQQGQAKVYKTRVESYNAFLAALNNATESIDIVSYVNLRAADAKRSKFYNALYTAMLTRRVNHQRIVWNLDQLLWLKQMLAMGWDDLPEFSVRFLRVDVIGNPLTTFDLIDQKMVFLGQGWLLEGHLELSGTEVGEFFRAYFAGLWNKSESLKERGKRANLQRIDELIQELSPK